MHQLAHKLVWYGALGAATAYAALKGGPDERSGAAIILLSSLLTGFLTSHPKWTALTSGALLIGCAANVYFLIASLRSDRWWPMWVTAFLLISNTALFAPEIDPASQTLAAYFGSVLWDYLTLLALVVGTVVEAR